MENQFFTVFTKSDVRDLIYGAVKEAIKTANQTPPEKPKLDNYLTRKETAKMLNVSLPTLHSFSKRGLLKSHKIGGRVLYKSNEVDEAIHKVETVKY